MVVACYQVDCLQVNEGQLLLSWPILSTAASWEGVLHLLTPRLSKISGDIEKILGLLPTYPLREEEIVVIHSNMPPFRKISFHHHPKYQGILPAALFSWYICQIVVVHFPLCLLCRCVPEHSPYLLTLIWFTPSKQLIRETRALMGNHTLFYHFCIRKALSRYFDPTRLQCKSRWIPLF